MNPASKLRPAFLTSDNRPFTDKKQALEHQKTLDYGKRVAALVDKFNDSSKKPFGSDEMAACDLFCKWLIDKGMFKLPDAPAQKKKKAVDASTASAKVQSVAVTTAGDRP